MKSAKRCRGVCSISEFIHITDKEGHQTDLSWVEQEDMVPEQFKQIRVGAATVLLPFPCARLLLHSSFREKMYQKLVLQNTGHTFSSLALCRGQARKTSRTSTDVSLTWLFVVPHPTCLQMATTGAVLPFLHRVPCVGSGDMQLQRVSDQLAPLSPESQSSL